MSRAPLWALAVGSGLLLTFAILAAEPETQPPPSSAERKVNVKKLFAMNCSWCHGAYGMEAEKGPRLAGTQMTEDQVRERIRNGKEGYMPPFGKVLSEEEIAAFAKYIKSLKPED